MQEIVAIIPCRGGSKEIPRKNLKPFLGQPLLYWTIEQLKRSKKVNKIFVTSDDEEILDLSKGFGASTIKRPKNISSDKATSESAWLHAINYLDLVKESIVLAPQVTSPLRFQLDFDNAINMFQVEKYDSLFSSSPFDDICLWNGSKQASNLVPVNYEPKNRKMRQELGSNYVENGSFYLFKCGEFKKEKTRLFGRIGTYLMKQWQVFEIDDAESFSLCEKLMSTMILEERNE